MTELRPHDTVSDADVDQLMATALARKYVNGREHRLARRDWLMVALMAWSGLRPGELLSLTVGSLRSSAGRTWLAVWPFGRVGSTPQPRMVPLARPVAREARRWARTVGKDPAARLFELTPSGLRRTMRALADEAGIGAKLRAFALRHTCGVRAASKRRDLAGVARELGHQHIASMERYARAAEAAARGPGLTAA